MLVFDEVVSSSVLFPPPPIVQIQEGLFWGSGLAFWSGDMIFRLHLPSLHVGNIPNKDGTTVQAVCALKCTHATARIFLFY